MKSQDSGRDGQVARVKEVLLSNMLGHLKIPLAMYFQMTAAGDRERHILECKRCTRVKDCVYMLLGEDIDPDSFCPNCAELKKLLRS